MNANYLGADTITPQTVQQDLSKLPGLEWLAGYSDGSWPDYQTMKAQNPNKVVEAVSAVDKDNDFAHWIDCENGDFTPQTAAARCARKIKRGIPSGIYTSRSAAAAAAAAWSAAAAAAAIPAAAIQWWIAEWTGSPHLPTAAELGIPGNIVICQYAGQVQNGGLGNIDLDFVSYAYLTQLRSIGGLAHMSDSLVMTDHVRTATGQGYWELRTDGAIYSFGDAVYYGGANQGNGIPPGTTAVSLSRTPSGLGYSIMLDSGQIYDYGDAVYEGGHTPPSS